MASWPLVICEAGRLGTSAAARARNVGAAFEPVVGPASTVFFVCAIRLDGARVPLLVTGVSALAVKIVPSPVQETEVTVPVPPTVVQVVPVAPEFTVSTCPAVPIASRVAAPRYRRRWCHRPWSSGS